MSKPLLTTNRVDRLLSDVRAAHQILKGFRGGCSRLDRALSHIEGHLENLNRLRSMVSGKGIQA
jgi:hypothetical protein